MCNGKVTNYMGKWPTMYNGKVTNYFGKWPTMYNGKVTNYMGKWPTMYNGKVITICTGGCLWRDSTYLMNRIESIESNEDALFDSPQGPELLRVIYTQSASFRRELHMVPLASQKKGPRFVPFLYVRWKWLNVPWKCLNVPWKWFNGSVMVRLPCFRV